MIKRGDVLVARRRLGFAAEGRREHFLIVQSDLLSGFDTAIMAPLDDDLSLYREDPLIVRVSAREAGTKGSQVVLTHLLSSVRLDRFEPAPASRLSAKSMVRVDAALRTVLSL